MEEEEALYTGSTWYITHHHIQDQHDIIEFDFLKLSVQHIIEKRKIVVGTLLVTPSQFIFDLDSQDPLDKLEPELFQVVFPTKVLKDLKIVLNNSKYNQNQIYQGPSLQIEEVEEERQRREYLYIHVCVDPDSADGGSQASSYGSPHLLPSYWFIIKNSQAPHLHIFFSSWFREAYLPTPPVSDIRQDLFTRTDCSVDETDRSILWQEEREGESEEEEEEEEVGEEEEPILSVDQRKQLALHLPARCITDSWDLVFSTARHGFSLRSLYRRCQEKEQPALLMIRTQSNITLGAFLSHCPAVSDNFYGTGESWLFSFREETVRIFAWTGENNFILQGNTESLVVGADSDGFGLWIDESLNLGRSHNVKTFNNDCLAEEEDFRINNLELWLFQH